MVDRQRGHRLLSHTADVIVEAWGPDLASCCEEAAGALADLYVDAGAADIVQERRVHLGPGPAEQLLLDVLDEVIFTLDTSEAVPVGVEVSIADDGGLDLVVALADRHAVAPTGAVPKAVSRSELLVESREGGVHCRFLVDV